MFVCLLRGEEGQYSDHNEWVTGVFFSEDKAKAALLAENPDATWGEPSHWLRPNTDTRSVVVAQTVTPSTYSGMTADWYVERFEVQ